MTDAPKNYKYTPALNAKAQRLEWLTERAQYLAWIAEHGTLTQRRSPGRAAELALIEAELIRRRLVVKVKQFIRPDGPYTSVFRGLASEGRAAA